jgi:uncharacterized protein (UPF0335 family)
MEHAAMADGGEVRSPSIGDNLDASTLLSIVKRLEDLGKEALSIREDVKVVKQEAKSAGFDVGVINFILRERRKDPDEIEEFHQELSKYRQALENAEVHDL